jgi:SAM-dependent methyltransferase/ribosomal protein L12E/L44/L45/RPP1/RPP2
LRGSAQVGAYNSGVSEESLTAQEAELEAIFSRLRSEVERWETESDGDSGGDAYPSRRREAEALWAVSAERPFLSRPGSWGRARGLALRPAKTVLRKLMRWYVEPLAADQRRFNAALLRLADALSERDEAGRSRLEQRLDVGLDEQRAARAAEARHGVELEERLTRLERRERSAAPAARAQAAPVPAAPGSIPDYFAFESRMRGSTESIRERQRPYVDDFRDAAPVLDIGCGRGEFLFLLREAGIEARGVDLDADMVAYARGEGLEVEHADAVEHLGGLEDGSLGGIFAAQLVEHVPAPTLVRLLELAAAKLRRGGLLVAETINPLSPLALRNYYADLTHAQPLVPETLELLARQAGFGNVELRYLNAPEERLVEPPDPVIAANVSRLNELLFGPLDYAIVART